MGGKPWSVPGFPCCYPAQMAVLIGLLIKLL